MTSVIKPAGAYTDVPTTASSNGVTWYFAKCGHIVTITANGPITAARSADQSMYTLPDGYRPPFLILVRGLGGYPVVIDGGSGNVHCQIALSAGAWFQFSATYCVTN